MTNFQFCLESGVPQNVIYRWARGESQPSTKYLLLIAEFFGTTVEYLMGGERESNKRKGSGKKAER